MSEVIDFDLHGIVGVRLVDAAPAEVAAVARQLGPIQATLDREPDVVVRFVDRVADSAALRTLGLDDAAYSDDAFLVLRGRHKSRARVRIPFEDVGGRCEIACEHGLAAVPLLVPIINATALAKGVLPLHAAAFEYRGTGVLATGWSKGGKTETLLGFMANGARYIGDEWVYLADGGRCMFGIPEPIRVWDWHLDHLPGYRARLGSRARLRLALLRMLAAGAERLAGEASGRSSAAARLSARALPILRGQTHVDWTPESLFGRDAVALEGRPDVVLLVGTHVAPDVRIEPIDPEEVAGRMLHSLEEERGPLLAYYRRFRFAFPARRNERIERAVETQRELLAKMLAGKRALSVMHPYPVAIPALFEAIRRRL